MPPLCVTLILHKKKSSYVIRAKINSIKKTLIYVRNVALIARV